MDVVCIPGIVKKSGADCGNDFQTRSAVNV